MNILNLFNKIKEYKNKDRSKLYIKPLREWSIILFLSTVFVLVVFYIYINVFNDIYINRFEESFGEVEMDPYKIKDLEAELFGTLEYYKEKEREYNSLLEKQPLFENKGIPVVAPVVLLKGDNSDVLIEKNLLDSEDLENETEGDNEGEDISTEMEPPEEEIVSKVFDHIQSSVSNTASVIRAFFD